MKRLIYASLLTVVLGCTPLFAQSSKPSPTSVVSSARKDSVVIPRPRTSPVAIATYKQKDSDIYVKAVYGQPAKRGRTIFGELEPFGQIWRTGANEATEITFTKDCKFGGKPLRAGIYTLFSIPDKNKWKIILNRELGQWGAFTYNESKNVLTVEVPVTTPVELYEVFIIKFDETKTGVDLVLAWDKTRVAIPLVFNK